MHITTNIETHIHTHIRKTVICFEISHIQIPHHVATSQFNPLKSKITGFHKMRNTRAEDPKTESSSKVNKKGLK